MDHDTAEYQCQCTGGYSLAKIPSAEVNTCSPGNGSEWRSVQSPYFYPPDQIDVRDGRHEHLLHERVLSVAVRGPVDCVVRYEEGQNMNQNSE